MFCSNCGKEIDNKAVVCVHCGCATQNMQAVRAEKPKSTFVALILCVFLGMIGVHDFYLKRNGIAITKLLILIFLGWLYVGLIINFAWCILDFFIILMGGFDAQQESES